MKEQELSLSQMSQLSAFPVPGALSSSADLPSVLLPNSGPSALQALPVLPFNTFSAEESGLANTLSLGGDFGALFDSLNIPGANTVGMGSGDLFTPVLPDPSVDNLTGLDEGGFSLSTDVVGDLDGDGDVDLDDMGFITSALNETALETTDPRDIDGDGVITVLDARKLALLFREAEVVVPNTAPQFVSTPNLAVTAGESYRYQVEATDADGDTLSYSLGQAPAGMSIDERTGLIQWEPDAAQVGFVDVAVEVSDGGAIATQTYRIETIQPVINTAPTIASQPLLETNAGEPYRYQVVAQDAEGDTLSYRLVAGPNGMLVDTSTGIITWTPGSDLSGDYAVQVAVSDGSNEATQQFNLSVVAQNGSPVISSVPVLTAAVGEDYSYDVRSQDPDGDELSYSLSSAPDGMTIDRFGRIRWTPAIAGSFGVEVLVSDGKGESITQSYSLTTTAVDTVAPVVSLSGGNGAQNINSSLTLSVSASDNVGVVDQTLTIDGVDVGLNGDSYAFSSATPGDFSAVFTATDAAGNTTSTTQLLKVRDFSTAGTAPTISLDALTGQTLTGPTDILGSIQDDNLISYTLSLASLGSNNFRAFHTGDSVTNGVLGTLDTSLFQDDSYTLRLTTEDGNGNIVSADTSVNISSELKLGNFTLSFTDMTLPVSGIPVAVTRTYDSLNANSRDDFGFGWRLEFRDTDLRTSLGRDPQFEALDVRSKGFKDGTKVFLTLPGGERQSFTFKPRRINSFGGISLGLLAGRFYEPEFETDDGGTSRLTVKPSGRLLRNATGTYTGGGSLFHPADALFGGVYILTTKEGIEYEIDGRSGDLNKAKDLNGNEVTFDDAGIYSDTGVSITFGRDAQGRIDSIADPEGNTVTYVYDTFGDLISVTDAESYTTQFGYRNDGGYQHYLEEISDPLGRTGAKAEYDAQGRLAKLFDVDGDPVEIIYDPANSTQTVKDALGNSTFYEYDERGNVIQQVDASGSKTFLTYGDANDASLVTRVTDDNGNVVDYTYDANGYLTSRTALHNPNNPNPETTTYSHNAQGQMTFIQLPTGSSFSMDYDGRGNLLAMKDGDGNIIQSYKYDARGRLIEESDPFGTTSYDNPNTVNDFDAFGNPYWMQDSTGEVTTMTYTNNGQLKTMTDSEGTSTFTYDGKGRETRADYGDGLFVDYGYGAEGDWTSLNSPTIGRIERKFTADGRLGGWVTADGGELTYSYDALGRLETGTTPDGRITRYEYDDVNRINRVIDVASGVVAETVSDNVGRVASRSQILNEGTAEEVRYTTSYTYNDDGKIASTTNPNGHTWRYEYTLLTTTVIDPLGRRTTTVRTEDYLPEQVRYADGTTASNEYLFDNNLLEGSDYPTRVIDRGGNDRVYGYDALGRLDSATDLGNNTYTYTYGSSGLTSITAPTGQQRQYGYDSDDNLTQILYGDSSAKQFDYDAENRLSKVTLESGDTITYTYDATGRLVSEASSTGDTVTTTYAADGSIAAITNSSGATHYIYDVLGNLSGIDSPNGSSIRYEHDGLGRTIKITEKATATAAEAVTQYRYDAVGNLIRVIDPTGGETNMTYDAVSRLISRSLPNGVTTTYGYNDVDQVTSMVHTAADGTVILSYIYERTGIGEPSKITREDGSYRTFVYDESLRLAEEAFYDATGALQETVTYSYDAAGNRVAHSDNDGRHDYTYDNGFQLVTVQHSSGTDGYTHDADGRLSDIDRNGESLDLTHNAQDQLTIVANATTGETVTYTYDGAGNRIGERSGSNAKAYLVAPSMGNGLSVQDLITDSTGNVLANHVYVGNTPLVRLDSNGDAVYYLTDAMGSVMGLVDSSGQSIATFNYDGFGNVRSTQGSDATGDALGGDYRFQSQWLESESGLYYFRARDYDAETGRFLSRDPVDFIETAPESFNPYQFVYNNPLIYSDPTGEITITELNGSSSVQGILNRINATLSRYAGSRAKDYALEKLGDATGNIVASIFNNFLPGIGTTGSTLLNILGEGGDAADLFEFELSDFACKYLEGVPLLDYLRFYPRVQQNGEASGGFSCSDYDAPATRSILNRNAGGGSRPDFIFISGGYKDNNPNSYLIGDVKLIQRSAYRDIVSNDNQWKAMANYARRKQSLPFVSYLSLVEAIPGAPDWRGRGISKTDRQKMGREAFKKGVILVLANLIDR